ncbi:ce850e8a-8f2c-4215-a86b-e0d1d307a292 [Sclerotinia trifoliorum]|uniref:Ce850e8a-8f2c-4215-a86b-e0d1d307a292 n=1 Tax=Sclerotinia trifoliorum TaxID=28548 RepID=A0A8H2ZLB2_9HELO|nr:ce850e8a-8f2c-4215-a86b-e0d1d307a292 [Sclerotinia trifoliorum]
MDSSPANPETTRLKLAFFDVGYKPEPPLVNFYRWFVLHSIHKRSFKNGAFQKDIPWFISGPSAWRIEKILFGICDSTLITDDERAILLEFLTEYHQQLADEKTDLSSGFKTIPSWVRVKRMFDMNDPNHIAGVAWFEESSRHGWAIDMNIKKPDEEVTLDTSKESEKIVATADVLDVDSDEEIMDYAEIMPQEERHQNMEMFKGVCSVRSKKVDRANQKGTKRVVSGTATRSTSPTKKCKAGLRVPVIKAQGGYRRDSGVEIDF